MCSFLESSGVWGTCGLLSVYIYLYVRYLSGLLESSVYGLNGRISDGTDPLLWCVVMEIYVNCLSGV